MRFCLRTNRKTTHTWRSKLMLHVCKQCGSVYDASRTTSLLRWQYCTALCEGIALGFDIKRATTTTVTP